MSSYSHPRGLCVDTLILDRVYKGVCLDLSGGPLKLLEESPREALDLRGLGSIALPGVVDMHVHLRGLELSYKEDESTGTLAALSGCVTAVVDMPNTKPPLRNLKALRAKLEALRDGAYVDYGVYAGVPDDEATVYELSSEPIAGFKVYPEDLRAPRRVLCSILKILALKGGILIVHAEHPDMLCVDYGFYRNTYRGCHVEAAAVDEVASLVKECGFKPRIHITHASCPSTVVKAKSYGFTVDVTPHHLLFDEDSFKPLASSWCESKVNPPLRGVVERSLLWRLLLEGYIDAIASDHAPHAPHEKIWLHPSQCSPGFPSLEDWVGALARLFNSINLLPLFAELTSINPARILGLPPREYSGSLSILALDLEESPGPIYSKARVSPYLNVYRLRCLATVIRGRIAYLKGEVMVGRGFGVNLFEARG